MIVIHASFPIEPEHRDETLDQVRSLVNSSQSEEGIIDYRAATDVSDPNVIRFIECYENEAAFESHARSDHFQAFEEQLGERLVGEPEVLKFEVESMSELDL